MKMQTHIWKYAFNYISSMALKCAVQLGIPDIIHNHGKPMSLSTLVHALSLPLTKSNYVDRLMRFLIQSGFFITQRIDENQEEVGYLLTPTSSLLVKDNKNTMSSVVLAMVDPVMVTPCHFLSAWFQGSGSTPFDSAYCMSLWNMMDHNSEFSKTYNASMANDSRLLMSVIVNEGKAVFENLKSLVDVGGGTGATIQALVTAFPHLKCMVLDLPNVVKNLPETNNIEFIGGDMFEYIPHADAVLMKRCREAIPSREEGGKVIIIDAVIEEHKRNEQEHDSITETQLLMDIMMMAQVDGKERSEKEWKQLFLKSGFTGYKIICVAGFRSLIEVYP